MVLHLRGSAYDGHRVFGCQTLRIQCQAIHHIGIRHILPPDRTFRNRFGSRIRWLLVSHRDPNVDENLAKPHIWMRQAILG